jgi:hypothetical protein
VAGDTFWQGFPDEFDQHNIRWMLYEVDAKLFSLRFLEEL